MARSGRRSLVSLLLASFLIFFSSPSTVRAQEAPPLRIGVTGVYPPFNYYNSSGELIGFDIDVSNKVCEELKRPCEFVILQWDGILAALLAGKIDLIIGSMAITPEREKQALFSVSYYESGAQIFSLDKAFDPAKPGVKIGVVLGTTYETVLRERFPKAEVRTFKTDPEALEDVKAGRLDALVTDRLVGAYMIKSSGASLVPVGDPLFEERMGIPARKEDAVLIAQVDDAVIKLRASPEYEQLAKNHFGIEIKEGGSTTLKWSTALMLLLKGLWATVKVSALGLALGLLLAALLAVVLEKAPPPLGWLARVFADFVRATPFMVQLFTVYFGLPALGLVIPAFTAAVLTIAVHSSAYLAEVFVAGYRGIPKGQRLASYLLGLNRWQTMRHVVFPQMVPLIAAPSLNTIVSMVKDSAIVSVISVYELTMQTQQLIGATYRPFELYLAAAFLYAMITYPLLIWGRAWAAKARRFEGAYGG